MLDLVEPAGQLTQHLASLGAPLQELGDGRWRLALDAAGYALEVELTVRGPLLRASAAVLPPGLVEPRQLLFWNGQAPLVCFAENRAGEVLVCGEVPLAALDLELLDRFLGLLLTSAARAREFVIRAA
jgi:hypothetical protein